MTTTNHTTLALAVAVATQNADTVEKVGVLSALVLSHVVCDAMPHGHYYGFTKMRETWKGASFELGFGLVGLPIVVALLSTTSVFWLFGCVFASSFFDFGVGLGIKIFYRINAAIHFWDKNNFPERTKWQWEIFQTVFLTAILVISIVRFG